jgi:hypothetical protein
MSIGQTTTPIPALSMTGMSVGSPSWGGTGLNMSGIGINANPADDFGYGNGMNVRIIPAHGGTIISIRDENRIGNAELYVLSESQNIAEEIGKIITLHYLKT